MIRRWKKIRRIAAASHVVLGAGGVYHNIEKPWVCTDIGILDITRAEDFARFWKPQSITAFLAEHVWEHLDRDHRSRANKLCYTYLKPGGWLRLAVPDGLHPDPEYIEHVRPGGNSEGARDHKVLFTYETLGQELTATGFKVVLLEYWDKKGQFNHSQWDIARGFIRRSLHNDPRNRDGEPHFTSLIVDARKPA